MTKLFLIAKREYIKTVRKPTFWIATLLLPAFIGLVSFISGYSATQAEQRLREEAAQAKQILVIDESDIVNKDFLQSPLVHTSDFDNAVELVKNGQADALFVYPFDILETNTVSVFAPDTGLLTRSRYDELARSLIKQSVLQRIDNPALIQFYNQPLLVSVTTFVDGEAVAFALEDFIVPGITILIYFLLTFLATNFLLMSVSEEKESRMIEIVLSLVTARQLIWGKLLGLTGVILTQLVVLASAAIALFRITIYELPITVNFSQITIEPSQILFSLFYLITGFLILACIMVGVGAALPTYREAQSFSSLFVMLSIFPIYFATLIAQEPEGTIAIALSYFPFTAPLILLTRHVLGALSPTETVLSSFVLIFYVYLFLTLAFKLFEFGSLQYTQRLSLKRLLSLK